jgi:hypothetical protein
MIDKLTRQEDFPNWRSKLIRTLQRLDLDKHILTDVPEPQDPEAKQQWRNDRADVDDYIQAVVPGYKVWSLISGMGWNPEESNPRKTFEMVTQYFEKGSVDGNFKMLHEFVNIRRATFDKMETFQMRVNYLRNRLNNTTTFKMHDEAYLWMVLKGLAAEYPDLYNRSVTNLQNNNLSWGDLMAELQQLAVTENAQPAMTNIKVNQGNQGNNDNKKPDDKKKGNNQRWETENCSVCHAEIRKGSKHCYGGCGKHYWAGKDGDTPCWWCHPDKAPDDWRPKAKAVELKNERQKSTTGPIHQQTGNNNPSTASAEPRSILKKSDNGNKVLFATNYDLAGIAMDPFQGGPQRS